MLIELHQILIHHLTELYILVILFLCLTFRLKSLMPSFGFRFNNSAHSYKGLFIKGAIPLHDTMKHPLSISGNDEDGEVVAE